MDLYSTEQVSRYHPDKFADQISDGIVALALTKNKNARCGVETLIKNKTVVVAGEIGNVSLTEKEVENVVRKVARKLKYKIDKVINLIDVQSSQINQAVDQEDGEIGAGDQGFMIGFATRETKSYLPKAFDLANKIIEKIEIDVIANPLKVLKGDAKTQVTYDNDEIKKVIVSVCHHERFDDAYIELHIKNLLSKLVNPTLVVVNPAGRWTVGGAEADAGVTGRKIVADQYGGLVRVGGGAFSGKDLSKVDRSGAYVARNIAIDVLKEFDKIDWVEIQLGYAIGQAEPISIGVQLNNNWIYKSEVERFIRNNYDLRPKALIKRLDLKPSDLEKLSRGCHYKNGYVGNWK